MMGMQNSKRGIINYNNLIKNSMRKLVTLITVLVMCSLSALAQQLVTYHGTVVDASTDEPLVGATVMPVGYGQGTATDVDGRFTLKVPANVSEIQVSYIGYHTIKETLKPNMTVKMKTTDQQLDDVMVVAFGTAKKSAFTGSAAVVKADALERQTTTNVSDALAGTVPGLQIRGGSGAPGSGGGSINIRGISSLYAGTSPLVIVDGAPYTASLSNIPQGDIESISVLKDAASAALYGARGASGVIIITTKRGNTADAKVSVDMKWGVNTRAVQEYDIIDEPGAYYEAYYSQLYNYSFYGRGNTAAQANAWANTTMMKNLAYQAFTLPQGESMIGMDGKLNPNAKLGYQYERNGQTYYIHPDNWTDLAYRKGFRQEYAVSATGGTDRISYYSSLNMLTEDGVVEYSKYNRVNARIKADYRAKSWLKLGANLSYTHSKTVSNPNLSTGSNSTNIMYYTSGIAPIYPAFVRVLGPDGKPMVKTDQYGHEMYDYGTSGAPEGYGLQRPFLATGNPLGNNRYNNVFSLGNQLNGTFTLDLNITSWLKFNATSTVIWGETQSTNYQNPFEGPKVSVNGELSKGNTIGFRTNNIQTLNFTKEFGHNSVTALVGHEYYKTSTRYLGASAMGGFSPEVPELDAFAKPQTTSSYHNRYNVEGWFLNAQYNWDEKYFASASYRRDASSYFAKDHRWGNFWSVGAAWILNRENFLSGVEWIDLLKIKASIGQQGNDNIGSYAYIDMYSLSKASDTQMTPIFWRVGNSDITWETTTNLNAGVEFEFWSRLSGNVDLYTKKTSNLLFWLSIPESMGSRGYYGNIGDIRNSGVELTLTGKVVDTRDVKVSVSGNIAHNTTKILSLPASKVLDKGGFFESPSWYEVGGPLYNRMTYKFAGLNEHGEATYWVDKNLIKKDGSMDTSRPGHEYSYTTTVAGEATRYCVGSVLPKAFGGFSLTAQAYGFDASVSFDYQLGGKIYDSRYASLMSPSTSASSAGSNFHKDILKAWSPDNTQSNIPRWQYLDQYATASSDRFLTSASYLNFQSFTVGYTIPKRLLGNFADVRVYCAGQNICFWSARKGLDPRYSFTANASMNVQSPVRTILGGVQVKF